MFGQPFPVVTQLMLLCCVNPILAGKGGVTPRSVFGRFSGVKGCYASLRDGRARP